MIPSDKHSPFSKQISHTVLIIFQILGLKGNPLPPEIIALHSEPNGTRKLVDYLLNNLDGKSSLYSRL